MARLMLSDELRSKLKEIMLQHQIDDKPNLRMVVETKSDGINNGLRSTRPRFIVSFNGCGLCRTIPVQHE